MKSARANRWLLVAAFALAGCASSAGTREPWVYGLSRGFYDSAHDKNLASDPWPNSSPSNAGLMWACILVLPFAVDTVLLPVTIPHDLLLVE